MVKANITLKDAMFELEKQRIIEQSDKLLDGAAQELMKCEKFISLLQTARGPSQARKLIKHLIIAKAISLEGCSASLKDVLSFLEVSYKYHGIYDEVRTFLNSMADAGVIDKFVSGNGKFIYASKATDKQIIEDILAQDEVKEDSFLDWFEKITQGTGVVHTCDHTDKRGKVCSANIKHQKDVTLIWGRKVWYYTCYSGHRGVIDFENEKHYYEENKHGGKQAV